MTRGQYMVSLCLLLFVSSVKGGEVFRAKVNKRTVFYTGHVFSLGQCAAIATRVHAKCIGDIPRYAFLQVKQSDKIGRNITCSTQIVGTPCMFGEIKYFVVTHGFLPSCDRLVLLYNDAMARCLRQHVDKRFWFSTLYFIGILLVFEFLRRLWRNICI